MTDRFLCGVKVAPGADKGSSGEEEWNLEVHSSLGLEGCKLSWAGQGWARWTQEPTKLASVQPTLRMQLMRVQAPGIVLSLLLSTGLWYPCWAGARANTGTCNRIKGECCHGVCFLFQ